MLPINEALTKYKEKAPLRMHMPNHGGRAQGSFLDGVYPFDLTELSETDNLFAPEGAIKESEEMLKDVYGSLYSFYSCGGATLAIQGAILSAKRLIGKRDVKVLCNRSVHRSVVAALAFSGITPTWLYGDGIPDGEEDFDIFITTTCDYFGSIPDLAGIRAAFKSKNTVLIADNSHGSHLMFLDKDKHALSHGFDFVIDSLHKTLPALTGSALLHIAPTLPAKVGRGAEEIAFTVKETMACFSSSSPSFLILASAELSVFKMRDESGKLKKSERLLSLLKEKFPKYFPENEKNFAKDPLRLVIKCEGNVKTVAKALKKHNIIYEFATCDSIVLITPFGFDEADMARIESALSSLPEAEIAKSAEHRLSPPVLKAAMTMTEAVTAPNRCVTLSECEGEISAQTYGLYPPGIPIIMPGEVFTRDVISVLREQYDRVSVVKNG